MEKRKNALNILVRFGLFISSYLPLSVIVIVKQLYTNKEYLNFGGFTLISVANCIKYFGASILLFVVTIIGFLILKYFFRNIVINVALNGEKYVIREISNKNSESIGYIATYIVPFLFQNFSSIIEFTTFVILMLVIYSIYINSSLIVVNPIINLRYSIYDVELANQNESIRKGIILCSERYLDDNDEIRIIEIGTKLYFSIKEDERRSIYEGIK